MLSRNFRHVRAPIVATLRWISGEEYRQIDWDTPALKYLRYIGVDIPNLMRLYKRLGKTKYFTRDKVADLVEFFDQVGVRGSAIKDAIICAPDLLRVPLETLEARACWYRDVFDFSHLEFRAVLELYPNLLEDKATVRFEEGLQYFKEMGIDRDRYKEMVLKCPTLLHNSIQDSVSKIVDFFLERGVEKSEMVESIVEYPELLTFSLMGHIIPKAHFFETELEVPQEKFAQLFVKHAWLLKLNLESDVRHTVQWLLDFGASKAALAGVIMKFPSILGYSVENNFKPKIDYFVHYLGPNTLWFLYDRCVFVGMPFGELATIIEQQPGFVGASLKEHIRPLVWYLEQELVMPLDDVRNVFLKAPALFGLSYGEVVKPTIDYFVDDLGCGRKWMAKTLKAFPQLLCYALEDNIKVKIQWLKDRVGITDIKAALTFYKIFCFKLDTLNDKLAFLQSQLELQQDQLALFVLADPSVLQKSVLALEKKIQFLETDLKKERKEIVTCPQYLGYDLHSFIQLRSEFLRSNGVDPASTDLKRMFNSPEAEFVQLVAKKKRKGYANFKERFMKQIQTTDVHEEDAPDEDILEQTFVQEQSLVPIEEVREAERRFARNFKYQSILE